MSRLAPIISYEELQDRKRLEREWRKHNRSKFGLTTQEWAGLTVEQQCRRNVEAMQELVDEDCGATMDEKEVLSFLNIDRSTLYRHCLRGRFPMARKTGVVNQRTMRTKFWSVLDIAAFYRDEAHEFLEYHLNH